MLGMLGTVHFHGVFFHTVKVKFINSRVLVNDNIIIFFFAVNELDYIWILLNVEQGLHVITSIIFALTDIN